MDNTLAWHESLELHEITAFNSIGLMKLKTTLPKIKNPELKGLYQQAIKLMEASIKELLAFYPHTPREEDEERKQVDETLFQGDLLVLTKTAVRNYGIAITETATPALKKVLVNQLNKMIQMHDDVFQFMYKQGNYPAYDLKKLFKHDMQLAKKALSL
ncbi:spore coat protein [Sediminibacillus halophilus]|uniref:Spore coat protein F n=1 Tax=Sediminibacillus halophilus TaxID=482461 RepID=A0A1G9X0I5_9BACI|nr:spore coat protein [Sediminibacillus halophilus]SDM90334.1 spore coat protein F [Sediminibacillus halophilus]